MSVESNNFSQYPSDPRQLLSSGSLLQLYNDELSYTKRNESHTLHWHHCLNEQDL